jgi:hemoglobin-like flavoprotein
MTKSASKEQILLARGSYARCQRSPGFFRRFYETLLASSPEIPGYFTHTEFDKQERLLEHGILLLLTYAKRENPALLTRLTERHGPAGLNIPVRLYSKFVTSLLATVQQTDPKCDQATLDAWESALQPGLAVLSGST